MAARLTPLPGPHTLPPHPPTEIPHMTFSLPPLPYDVGALAASGMCQETLELHHGKHHQAYVTALNGMVEAKGLAGKTLEEIVAEAGKGGADMQPVLNQAGQHWNHILFWQCMQATASSRSPRRRTAPIRSRPAKARRCSAATFGSTATT
jgi:superoxide dismutase